MIVAKYLPVEWRWCNTRGQSSILTTNGEITLGVLQNTLSPYWHEEVNLLWEVNISIIDFLHYPLHSSKSPLSFACFFRRVGVRLKSRFLNFFHYWLWIQPIFQEDLSPETDSKEKENKVTKPAEPDTLESILFEFKGPLKAVWL